ncbi:uncharacterized protein LOC144425248 [Styela clava]
MSTEIRFKSIYFVLKFSTMQFTRICSTKKNLRMLPCWHVACMNCILSMTQRDEGRAVKCHECRQICLFENIRYLPKPLRCGCCNQFRKCSKIMPCCSKLFCIVCITKKSTNTDARLTCPGRCPQDLNSIDELPQSKLCSLCFRLHSDDALLCGHTVCAECDQKLQKEKRGCPLCSAVKNPAPTPTNPIQSVQGQVVITMEGLDNLNYRSQQQNHGTNLRRALRRFQELDLSRNIRNEERMQESEDERTMKKFRDDLPKLPCIFTCVFVAGYFYGMSLMFWIILGASMLITRPHLESAVVICRIVEIGILAMTLYRNFYQVISYFIFNITLDKLLEKVHAIAVNRLVFYRQLLLELVGAAIRLAVVWAFFDNFLIHAVLITWLGMFLNDQLAD